MSDQAHSPKPVSQLIRSTQNVALLAGGLSPSPIPSIPRSQHGAPRSPLLLPGRGQQRCSSPSLLSPRPTGLSLGGNWESARNQALSRSADRLMPSRALLSDAQDGGLTQRFQECSLMAGSPSQPTLEPRQAARMVQIGCSLGLDPPTRPLLKFSPPSGQLENHWKTAMKARTGPPITQVKPDKLLDFAGGQFCDANPRGNKLIACIIYEGECITFADVEQLAEDKQHLVKSVSKDDYFTDAKFTCDGNYAALLEVTGRVIIFSMEKLTGDAFALATRKLDFDPYGNICTHPSHSKILAWSNLAPKIKSEAIVRIVDIRAESKAVGNSQLGLSMSLVAEKQLMARATRSGVVITSDRAQPSLIMHETQPVVVASSGDGTIHIIDYRQLKGPLVTFKAHPLYSSDVCFNPMSSWDVISAGNDGVKIFNLSTSAKRLENLSQHEISTICTIPEAGELLVGYHDPVLHQDYGKKYNAQIFSLRGLQPMGLLYLNPRDEGTHLLRYSSSDSMLITVQKELDEAGAVELDNMVGTLSVYQGISPETGLFPKYFPKEQKVTPFLPRSPAAGPATSRPKQLFSSPMALMPR